MPRNNSFEGVRSRERNNAPRKPKLLKKLFKARDIEPKKKEASIRQRRIDREEANQSIDRGVSDFSFGPERSRADRKRPLLKFLNSLKGNNTGRGNSGLVGAAEDFEGARYVRGGQSENGIDCSGLVVEAMRKEGYNIPDMTAAEMQRRTPRISSEQAQAGDLLVWNNGSHVEIVKSVTPEGQIITIGSASSKGGVGEHVYNLSGKSVHRNTL